MNRVYGILLALIALIIIVCNRWAVQQSFNYGFIYEKFRPPVLVARAIVIVSGAVLFVLALLLGFDLITR